MFKKQKEIPIGYYEMHGKLIRRVEMNVVEYSKMVQDTFLECFKQKNDNYKNIKLEVHQENGGFENRTAGGGNTFVFYVDNHKNPAAFFQMLGFPGQCSTAIVQFLTVAEKFEDCGIESAMLTFADSIAIDQAFSALMATDVLHNPIKLKLLHEHGYINIQTYRNSLLTGSQIVFLTKILVGELYDRVD